MRTKRGAATLSIASNALLIALKIAAGAITGSIAIITEAAHSAIDLVASVIALVSVRKADEPPDPEHPYGHEKVENLAAAIEGMLILVGAGIIVYEATRRLVVGLRGRSTSGSGIAVIGFSAVANLGVSAFLGRRARALRLAGARGRRRPPARRRADLARRARRARRWSQITGNAVFDPIAALVVAGAIVFAGHADPDRLLAGAGGRGAAARGARSDRGRDRGAPARRRWSATTSCARAAPGARRYVDLHVQFRSGTTLEDAHSTRPPPRDGDRGGDPRLRGADPRRARGSRARTRTRAKRSPYRAG